MGRPVEITRGPFDPGGQPDTRSGNKIELGLFAWNLSCGLTGSKAVLANPGRYRDYWHWDTALHLNQLAERIGFEYQVPFGRWHGYGGESGFLDEALDFLTSAACLAPVTSRLGLFSTTHVTYKFHPLHIAKIGATIDYISGGRWGLNVVTGSGDGRDNGMFGQKPYDHDEAYELADEFVSLMKWLWSSADPIDFEGRFFRSYDAIVSPKPVRKPRPTLINAGNSPAGLDFACKQCDWAFLTCNSFDDYRQKIDTIRLLSGKYGRTVRPSTMCYAVMAETDKQAKETMDWIEEEVDEEAVNAFIQNMSRTRKASSQKSLETIDGDGSPSEQWYGMDRERYMRWAIGIGAWRLVGSYETVAEEIQRLHELGLESLLMSFFDPVRGLHQMEDDVIPILKKMGLRN